MNSQYKAILESYGRSFLVAVLAVISTGETSLTAIALGGLVAVLALQSERSTLMMRRLLI